MFDLLIFDFDGTICNSRNSIEYCVHETYRHSGISFDNTNAIHKTINKGITLIETFEILNDLMKINYPIEMLVETYRKLYNDDHIISKNILYHRVEDVLKSKHIDQVNKVIVSNKGIKALSNILKMNNIDECFSLIVGDGNNYNYKKPDAILYQEIIKPKFTTQVDKILVIGDTELDIAFAKNIGAKSCWAKYGYGQQEALKITPDYIIENPIELLGLVSNVRSAI